MSLLLNFGCQPVPNQSAPDPQPPKLSAKIIDSCAPFDGAAFQVSIKRGSAIAYAFLGILALSQSFTTVSTGIA
jgi:hypothetical protein